MIVDARELEQDSVLDADVCIVGAGPAGIALAQEFDGRRLSVVLLESGGLELDESLQALGQAAEVRLSEAGPLRARRQFGGNANAWSVRTHLGRNSVRLTRLSEIDFERRHWIEDSGWPIGLADLASHYERARRVFQLDPGTFDTEDWEDPVAFRLAFPGGDVDTAVFQFGSGETLTELHRRRLKQSRNVRVCHHATAIEIETDPAASNVTAVRAASRPGRELRVCARYVVLTCGGMACAQLLLLSSRAQPEGLGNRHDLVGRYFMDHPLVKGGKFVPNSSRLFEAMTFYDLRTVRGVPVMGHLQIADVALRRERLLQLSMLFFPRRTNELARRETIGRQEQGVQASLRIRGALRRREPPTLGDLRKALHGVANRAVNGISSPGSNLGHGGWSKGLNAGHEFGFFEIIHQAEQRPRRDNRVRLSDQRDALGCQKIAVDWRWHEADITDTMRAQDLYAAALERAGLGRFEILRPEGRPHVRNLSTAHYMGTTRMHSDPRHGVVDEHCEVHGVRNLYLASSSVFTTGGFANPTLTILAIALRIGDRLKRRIGAAVEVSADAEALRDASTNGRAP